jgi:hypothetical protein
MVRIIEFLLIVLFSSPSSAQVNQMEEYAKAGWSICQLELGKAYAFGDGVNQDLGVALYWLNQKPHQNGNIPAIDLIIAIETYKNEGDSSQFAKLKAEYIEQLADTQREQFFLSQKVIFQPPIPRSIWFDVQVQPTTIRELIGLCERLGIAAGLVRERHQIPPLVNIPLKDTPKFSGYKWTTINSNKQRKHLKMPICRYIL